MARETVLYVYNFYLLSSSSIRLFQGMRMAKVVTKMGMATVLTKFNIELDDLSLADKELEIDPVQFIHTPLRPFKLKLTPRVTV